MQNFALISFRQKFPAAVVNSACILVGQSDRTRIDIANKRRQLGARGANQHFMANPPRLFAILRALTKLLGA
jgi:hypothetical protein